VSLTDAEGQITQFFYDHAGRLIREVRPNGWVENLGVKGDGSFCLGFGSRVKKNRPLRLFDPHFVEPRSGLTNIQRMQRGLAPIGRDGKPVNLHHVDQTNTGPIREITATEHQQNFSNLHQNTGQNPSQINRQQFDKWRQDYWIWRAESFIP